MKVLLTGAAGYLAGHIIDRLRPLHDLTLTDRVAPDARFADLPFVEGDVTRLEDMERACEGQEAVVHTVALVRERFGQPPAAFADVMVKGTWHVAEACVRRGVGLLVNISSIIAGGWPADRSRPSRPGEPFVYPEGDLYYCLAKRLGEEVGLAYHQAHGLRVISLRPGIIARDGFNAEPARPAEPVGQWFMHVDPLDVAQAVEGALAAGGVSYGCYNIVAGRRDGLYDWAAAAEEVGYRPEHNWPETPED